MPSTDANAAALSTNNGLSTVTCTRNGLNALNTQSPEILQQLDKDPFLYKTVTKITKKPCCRREPRDAAVNSDRYEQPIGQKQSESETENIT